MTAQAHPAPAARPAPGPLEGALWTLGVFALCWLSVPISSDALLLGNDVVPYAAALAEGSRVGWINPHHLLFHPLAGALAIPLGWILGPGIHGPLLAQIGVSALAAGLCTLALWSAAWSLAGGPVARLVALGCATSLGTWLYGSVGETYLPASAAIAFLFREAVLWGRGPRPLWKLGALSLLAALLRQDSVLAVPFVLLALPREARRGGAVWVLAAGALCLGLYALAHRLADSGLAFWPWLRGLADSGLWGATPGGRELLFAAVLTAAAQAWAAARAGLDLLAGRFDALALGFALAPLLLAASALLGAHCALRSPRPPADRPSTGPRATPTLAVALAAYGLTRFGFFAWWQPSNLEYHAGTWVPLWLGLALLLGAGELGRGQRAARWLLGAGVWLGALGNWTLLLGPARASEEAHRRAAAALAAAGPGGLAVALDPLQHYAHLRALPGPYDPGGSHAPRLWDGSRAAGGPGPEAEGLAREIAAELARGGRVALATDLMVPAHLGTAAPPLDGAVLFELMALGRAEVHRDGSNRVWLVELRPKP